MSNEHDQHDAEEHIDERWLVSYADMMTLLFGLFVMLYSMAMEHQGDFDKQLQKIAEEKFTEKPEEVKPPIPEDPEKLKAEIVRLKAELETAVAEIEKLKLAMLDMEPKKIRFEVNEDEYKKMVKELEELKKSSQDIAKVMQERDEALKKLKELEKSNKDIAKVMNERDEAIKKMKELEKELEQKRKIASVPDKREELAKALEDLKKERIRADELEKELKKKEEQMQAMQPKEPPKPQPRGFGLVLLKWSTKLHDLDMVLKDPKGNKFDFKHRTSSGAPGEFVLDSRTGPGAEIWQSEKLIPGTYELKISLYQSYGNSAPAEASVSFQTALSNIEIGKIMLTEADASRTIKFNVDKDGKVTKL